MKYIANWSGGKDSTASVILAHEHGEPIDLILFSEVLFSNEISGELKEHISFMKETCIPIFQKWGYETEILHSRKTYLDIFYHVTTRGKNRENVGKRYGFPMAGKCAINRECKLKPIYDFLKQYGPCIQYIGIAMDEPQRLERLKGTNKISLLEKYGYTEKMAYDLCKEYGLLSPIYAFTKRGGCWFCPNAKKKELEYLRTHHRDLWNRLLELEKEPDLVGKYWNTLTKQSMADNEKIFQWEDEQVKIWELLEDC